MTVPFRPRYGRWPAGLPALAGLAVAAALAAAWTGSLARQRVASTPAEVARAATEAERTMQRAEHVVRLARLETGIESEAGPDPSGLLGGELTPLVTTLGSLEAKRIATNPAWARALVLRLHGAGIGRGSVVAAGFSGSFPGLDLAVTVACQALGADLLAISSVTASSWGANQPGFTWPEIEARLVRAGLVRRASIAVSTGGAGDRARDLEPEGRAEAERIMREAARELGVPAVVPAGFQEAVAARLDAYDHARRGRPVALYVNVGGTEASLGRSPAVLRLRSGFVPGVPFDFSRDRGVMARFAERGVPLLTLLNVRDLALRWRIPL